jgi:hypothetical protein
METKKIYYNKEEEMNEFNKVRFRQEWIDIRKFLVENKVPHFQDGQIMIIITESPTKLYSLLKGFSFNESFWYGKLILKIHNDQFKLRRS